MPKHTRIASKLSGFTDNDGYLTSRGIRLLVQLLKHLKLEQWGEAFIPLKKCGVHCAVELIIIHQRKVLLTWRNDRYFKGWHTPGSYLNQGESWQDAATRCARREIGVDVDVVQDVKTFNNVDNLRFHDQTTLLLCSLAGDEPMAGQWFKTCPPDLIYPHEKYWPVIASIISPFETNMHMTI